MPKKLMSINLYEDKTIIELSKDNASIRKEIERLELEEINKLTKAALAAFQSKVPVKTKQLRNQHIQVDFAKKNQKVLKSSVYIVDQEHTATTRGKTKLSSLLGEILNKGIHEYSGKSMRRSMNSIPKEGFITAFSSKPKGSPTEGWIEDAQLAFLAYARLLSRG